MTQLLWHFARRLVYISASLLLVLPLATLTTLANAAPTHAASKILVFGDSLSAAYGILQADGWVNLLDKKLSTKNIKVINASISGETTSGGLSRIAATLKQHQPNIVIIELGANDGLQGLSIKQMQANLRGMITASLKAKSRVLLVGMNIPPNYGSAYQIAFRNTFPQLAREYKVSLVPFLLDGIAGKPELNQEDGIHPKATSQPQLLENVWVFLKQLL